MRVLGVAFVSVVAACYSPSYRDCEITCASGACPSGFVCDQNICRAEGFSGACGAQASDGGVDTSSADDTDGDGVPNDRDNCKAKSNPTQANEDQDTYGDACDPCPISADPLLDVDSDGDGVGNGCDPNGNMPGASIALFEGFHAPAAPSDATLVPTDGWMFPGDRAIGISTGNIAALMTWPVASTNQVVRAKMTITALANMPLHGAGIVAPLEPSTNNGVICWVLNTQFQLTSPTSQTPYMSTQVPVLDVGSQYEFRLTRTSGAEFDCREAGNSQALIATLPASMLTGQWAGVFVENVTAQIDWILVVNQ